MVKGIRTSSRMLEFEALRALAILLLMPLHSGFFAFTVQGIYLGPLANFVGEFLKGSFFFLAGYFANRSLGKRDATFFSFIWSKFVRIFPPYWISFGLFVTVLGYSLRHRDQLIYLLNLQFLFSPTFAKQVLTLWFISVLLVYFVMFGLLLLRRISNLSLLIWSAVIFMITYFVYRVTGLFDGRFFEYFFIFLAGIYFSRMAGLQERIYGLHLVVKLAFVVVGVGSFWLAQLHQAFFTSWQYLLTVDLYIVSLILLCLDIFRSPVGNWRIWGLISYASFFAYLFHRVIWQVLSTLFVFNNWYVSVLFIIFPGSVVVFSVSYFLQYLYDRLLFIFQNKVLNRIRQPAPGG